MTKTQPQTQLHLLQGFLAVKPIQGSAREVLSNGGIVLPEQSRLKKMYRGEVVAMSEPWTAFQGAQMSWGDMEVGDTLLYDGMAARYDYNGQRLEVIAPNRVVGFEKNPHA